MLSNCSEYYSKITKAKRLQLLGIILLPVVKVKYRWIMLMKTYDVTSVRYVMTRTVTNDYVIILCGVLLHVHIFALPYREEQPVVFHNHRQGS